MYVYMKRRLDVRFLSAVNRLSASVNCLCLPQVIGTRCFVPHLFVSEVFLLRYHAYRSAGWTVTFDLSLPTAAKG